MMSNSLQKYVSVTPAISDYQHLLADISRIFEDAKDSTLISVNKIRNRAYWMIGERIVNVEQNGKLKAEYGSRLLENLSRDLSFKYKNGFSVANLRAMRQFYVTHPIRHPGAELTWSHHKLLLTIKDLDKRYTFERLTKEKGWSKRELRKALSDNKIELEADMTDTAKKAKNKKIKILAENRGRLFHYRLVDLNLKPEGHLLVVDCGFKILRRVLTEKVYLFHPDEIIETVKGREQWKIQKVFSNEDVLYTYKAYPRRVVDGDTLLVDIDCGFDTWVTQRLRLKGINCPEVDNPKGAKAKKYVEDIMKQVDFLIIRTSKSDKYDRYLADIFYLPEEEDPSDVADKGRFLNQELLDQKLAKGV